MYGDSRILRAQQLEAEAKLLRKEYSLENILHTQGPMSEAYRRVNKEVQQLRNELWGKVGL